jgi:hypothetical protein
VNGVVQRLEISGTTPTTQAHGDSAVVGADGAAADALHKHAMPGAGAAGAPTDVNYLVGTADGDLSAEIVVGTAPGGELGGSWASPTVDGTHSGTAHHAASDAGPPNGTASGELGGTYPSPTVDSTHSGSAHHAQSHSLASHSSEAHSELTSIGANDHHNESHSHAGGGESPTIETFETAITGSGTFNTGALSKTPKYCLVTGVAGDPNDSQVDATFFVGFATGTGSSAKSAGMSFENANNVQDESITGDSDSIGGVDVGNVLPGTNTSWADDDLDVTVFSKGSGITLDWSGTGVSFSSLKLLVFESE